MNVDSLIVGGGIHGIHMAARLIGEVGLDRQDVCIVDPEDRLLSCWLERTARTGMTYLRSPSVHHLDLHPWSLQRFAGPRKLRKGNEFAAPYDRPSLKLFNRHSARVIEKFGLAETHVRGRVLRCRLSGSGVEAELDDGRRITAERVILSLGSGARLRAPEWATGLGERVQHIFGARPILRSSGPERVAVVGGGVTAGQVALRLLDEGHRVELVSRHDLRVHQFDSDPGWMGPRNMTGYRRIRDYGERRATIASARNSGSMPPRVAAGVRREAASGRLRLRIDSVDNVVRRDEMLDVRLRGGGTLRLDRVALATGFEPQRPGGALVDGLIASAALPIAACGFPIVDAALRWHPRLFVTGPLAELELGPTARNIIGARHAADRVVDAIRASTQPQFQNMSQTRRRAS